MKSAPFILRVLIVFVLSLIPVTELENRIYSGRMELRGTWDEAANIRIIEFEPYDFNQLKRRFSKGGSAPDDATPTTDRMASLRDLSFWDPAFFRETLKLLLAKDPAAILVSWYIPNEVVESLSDPAVEQLARNPKVVWSAQFDPDGKYIRPPSRLVTRGGFNNLEPDSDGVVRRSVLAKHAPGKGGAVDERSSLTLTLAGLARATPDPLAHPRGEPFFINYAGPAGTVRACRLVDIVSRKAPADCLDLKGKILLLKQGSDRVFLTPFGEMSRAEIIANEINTVVNHKPIYTAPFIAQILLILAMIVGGAFYIIYYPVVISAIAVTGTGVAVAIILFQLVFQLLDIYIPSANIAGSLLITYLVFTGYRLEVFENLQWRALKQAQYVRELDQMKNNFLSLVSHDLKTPIAKIQAVVERLRREERLPPGERSDFGELLESIENSNNELKNYITSILNLSRIESQKVILNKKSNDINQIVGKVLRRLKALAVQKNIDIVEQLEPLFSVECDEDLIRQVLSNLVDNAIKYSPRDSRVIVRSSEVDGMIQVEVEDFGPGIPKDQLPLMFRKFSRYLRPSHPAASRGREPYKEAVKGTGLGLYLSKYFIELHGGQIRLKTAEGQGTTFTFTLPLQSAATGLTMAKPAAERQKAETV